MRLQPHTYNSSTVAPDARKIQWAVILGNGLIAYDFTVYSFSAVTIGLLFFPFGNHFLSLLLSLATFGAGFIMRPLGAVVIGNLADRKGRKTGLLACSALMTLGTGVIAFVPTYDSIGPTATVLIVLARLTQGFVAGGEVGVVSAVLLEANHNNHRCYRTSWRGASQGASALLGALVGAVTNTLLSSEQIHQWGWRVPFILGMLIAPVGWYLRRQMSELHAAAPQRASLRQMFAQHQRQLLCGMLMMAAPAASIYIMVFYLPTYLVTILHQPPVTSLLASCVASVVILIGTPLMASVADRRRSLKPIQAIALLCCIVSIYPAFAALTHDIGQYVSLLIIAAYAAVSLTSAGASSVMIMSAFPRHHRAAGMSVVYSVGSTLFGGFSPFIVTWLISSTGMRMVPAWYLLAASSISLLALLAFPVNNMND